MRKRTANRADLLDLAPGLHERIRSARLRHAEGVDETPCRKHPAEIPDPGLGRLLAARNAPPEAAHVVTADVGQRQDPPDHHGCHPGAGQAVSFDRLHRRDRIKFAMHAEQSADPQHANARQIKAAHVVKRTDHQQALLLRQAKRNQVVHRLPVNVAVGVHDPLGARGRAGGIHQADQVGFLRHVADRNRQRRRERARIGCCRIVHDDFGDIERLDRVEFLVDEQQFGPGIVQDVIRFGRGQTVIDGQEYRAQITRRKGDLKEGRTVFHEKRDDVAGADPPRMQ